MSGVSDDPTSTEVEITPPPLCGVIIGDPIDPTCCEEEIIPWGCDESLKCKLDEEELELFTDEDLLRARAWATEILDKLTGHQYGLKRFRGMPCGVPCGWCRCDPCSCCAYDALNVPHHDICRLDRVVINSETQALSQYRIDYYAEHGLGDPCIVKLDGAWPNQQCWTYGMLDESSDDNPYEADDAYCLPDSWWVEYTYGCQPPMQADIAVACLAQQFLYLCSPLSQLNGKCQLPGNVVQVSRQGVSYQLDPSSIVPSTRTGIGPVDSFLKWANPKGLCAGATVYTPSRNVCDRRWISTRSC